MEQEHTPKLHLLMQRFLRGCSLTPNSCTKRWITISPASGEEDNGGHYPQCQTDVFHYFKAVALLVNTHSCRGISISFCLLSWTFQCNSCIVSKVLKNKTKQTRIEWHSTGDFILLNTLALFEVFKQTQTTFAEYKELQAQTITGCKSVPNSNTTVRSRVKTKWQISSSQKEDQSM